MHSAASDLGLHVCSGLAVLILRFITVFLLETMLWYMYLEVPKSGTSNELPCHVFVRIQEYPHLWLKKGILSGGMRMGYVKVGSKVPDQLYICSRYNLGLACVLNQVRVLIDHLQLYLARIFQNVYAHACHNSVRFGTSLGRFFCHSLCANFCDFAFVLLNGKPF